MNHRIVIKFELHSIFFRHFSRTSPIVPFEANEFRSSIIFIDELYTIIRGTPNKCIQSLDFMWLLSVR